MGNQQTLSVQDQQTPQTIPLFDAMHVTAQENAKALLQDYIASGESL